MIAAIIFITAAGIGLLLNLAQCDTIDLINITPRFLIAKHSERFGRFFFHSMSKELDKFPQNLTEAAINGKNIVSILHGTIYEGTSHQFDQFVARTSEGKTAQVIIAEYTTEGDPIYKNVVFDGGHFFTVIDNSRDRFRGENEETIKLRYDYLKIITYPETGSKFVILTNDSGLTFEKLRDAQIKSDMESIDSYQLFSYFE